MRISENTALKKSLPQKATNKFRHIGMIKNQIIKNHILAHQSHKLKINSDFPEILFST